MRAIETSAKTRQEAIKKALDELGVELHEVEIEILNEGSKGIFGFGARDVRVRVSTEVPGPEPRRQEKRERREERPVRPEKPVAQEGQRAPRAERGDRLRQGKGGGRGEKPAHAEKPQQRPEQQQRPEKPQQRPEKPQPRRERPAAQQRAQRPRAEAPKPAPPREPLPPISDERREEVAAFLREILEKMGFDATVTCMATEDGDARLNIESADSAILIGRKGNNLEALQYLVNRMITTSETDLSERVLIDIEGYLDRRRQSIEEMARQLALKAKETAREVHMKPMSAQERRIVHVTLQDDPDVRTFSTGASSTRSVVIQPKNQARDGGRGGSRRPRRGPRPEGQAQTPNKGEAQTQDNGASRQERPPDSGDAQES
ncbi:MAG: Jag N-terminal domain-containing protein [Candidatus Hydrogenedentes bacterium]|nr:Jag N-terminal domain-containing protein [Candidatus Hydrogenedentota bacterium]